MDFKSVSNSVNNVSDSLNHVANYVLQASDIPKDLDSVISIDSKSEVDPQSVDMTQADIDRIWDSVIDLYQTGAHPAISITLRRRGEIIMSRAIGHAQGNGPLDNAETPKVLATPDTPYNLFSASKGVTALLMHMLAEDGLVNIMDPVAYYAPEFACKGKENITIHQILAHRGGVPGLPADVSFEEMWDEDRTWRLLCESEPIATDGSKLAYHAITGGFILERVMRAVTGDDYNAYIDKKVRQPMGMKYFRYGLPEQHWGELATSYATGLRPGPLLKLFIKRALGMDASKLEGVANDPRIHHSPLPSANLFGSANELANFFQMLLDGGVWQGKRICLESTVARATQEFGNRSVDGTIRMPLRYSAGLMLGDEPFGIWGPHSHHAFGHVGLINKFCWADPERELSASILNNGMPYISTHLPAVINMVRCVGNTVPRVAKVKQFSLAEANT